MSTVQRKAAEENKIAYEYLFDATRSAERIGQLNNQGITMIPQEENLNNHMFFKVDNVEVETDEYGNIIFCGPYNPNLITFICNDVEAKAEYGMTIRNWLESKYNTSGCTIDNVEVRDGQYRLINVDQKISRNDTYVINNFVMTERNITIQYSDGEKTTGEKLTITILEGMTWQQWIGSCYNTCEMQMVNTSVQGINMDVMGQMKDGEEYALQSIACCDPSGQSLVNPDSTISSAAAAYYLSKAIET